MKSDKLNKVIKELAIRCGCINRGCNSNNDSEPDNLEYKYTTDKNVSYIYNSNYNGVAIVINDTLYYDNILGWCGKYKTHLVRYYTYDLYSKLIGSDLTNVNITTAKIIDSLFD